MSETTWYARLRRRYRPDRVRVLLIGESAPDPGAAERRFFYAPTLDRRDNLFRGVIAACYGESPGRAGDSKTRWLQRLHADGVYLIDLVPFPVDKLARAARARARREHAAACVRRARALSPDAVIVCHAPSFDVLAAPLRAARLPLRHERRIPFPLGNHRAAFVAAVRTAIDGPWSARPGLRP